MYNRNNLGIFVNADNNELDVFEDYAIVWTTDKLGNKKIGYKIDLDDIDLIKDFRWSVGTDNYAKYQKIKMHRLIKNAKSGQIVDHINQDVTDNRKSNLRFVSHSLNMRNSSKTKSSTGHKHIILNKYNIYSVHLKCRGNRYYIGKLRTIEDALNARNSLYNDIKYFDE